MTSQLAQNVQASQAVLGADDVANIIHLVFAVPKLKQLFTAADWSAQT